MVTQNTTAQPSYDPENEGAWDGQLAHADLVVQLPPPIHPVPDPDNTVWTLFKWAQDLDIKPGPRLALFAILRDVDWTTCKGWASVPKLAKFSQMTVNTMTGHIQYLVAEGIITRHRRMNKSSETRLNLQPKLTNSKTMTRQPTVNHEIGATANHQIGVTDYPTSKVANQSSSTNTTNQRVPSTDDKAPKGRLSSKVKQSSKEVPATIGATFSLEQGDGATTGDTPSSLEEERTGTRDYQASQDYVDEHLSEIPTNSEIANWGHHCWPAWEKHWDGGWTAAVSCWTKDTASRKKFRKDVVAQLAKVGLPKPMAPNAEDQAARKSTAEWMDQRLAEGANKRMVDVWCETCGERRQLPPGETLCHSCRKTMAQMGVNLSTFTESGAVKV